jgi:outer membrane receptor protein involved in Fe transport
MYADTGSNNAKLNNSISESLSTSLNIQTSYSRLIGKHNTSIMAGVAWDKSTFYRNYVAYVGLADDYVLTNAASAITAVASGEADASSGINSFYSRAQYTYDEKYTATFNFRSDRSSKFGPENQVAYFPSISLNWNIDKEEFITDIDFINRLIFRSSYGKSGSANVADFAYSQFFEVGSYSDKEYVPGMSVIIPSTNFPNRNIKWETTKELNLGIDFSLLSNRLYGSFDIYNKKTDGVLIPAPFPRESGSSSFTSNLAKISNKASELEVGGDIIKGKDFTWSLNFNIATNHNKVVSIEGNAIGLLGMCLVGNLLEYICLVGIL